jgi:hypothetical protein
MGLVAFHPPVIVALVCGPNAHRALAILSVANDPESHLIEWAGVNGTGVRQRADPRGSHCVVCAAPIQFGPN